MAKPVDHNIGSTVATVGGETIKMGALGLALPTVLGGILAVAVGAIFTTMLWPLAAIGVVGAVLGGVFGAPIAATLGLAGAGFGIFKGASRVAGEQTQYNLRASGHENLIDAKTQTAQVQQAYIAGARDGQAQLVARIEEQEQASFAQRELQKRAQAAQAPTNGKA